VPCTVSTTIAWSPRWPTGSSTVDMGLDAPGETEDPSGAAFVVNSVSSGFFAKFVGNGENFGLTGDEAGAIWAGTAVREADLERFFSRELKKSTMKSSLSSLWILLAFGTPLVPLPCNPVIMSRMLLR
jgi:hypothetical protein